MSDLLDPKDGVWAAMRALLIADAPLGKLLGKDTAGEVPIYWDRIARAATFPCISALLIDDGADQVSNTFGDFRPRLDLSIFAVKESTISRILERLDENLQIPRKNTLGIENTKWKVREMHRVGNTGVGETGYTVDSVAVRQRATEWLLRAARKNA